MKNKKGFTLIEVLLIILLIGMLATTAFTSFFDTSETFTFLSEYKPIISDIRKARSFAINNKNSDTYERHGIYLDSGNLWLFGDIDNPFNFDGSNDVIIEHLTFSADYELELDDADLGNTKLPYELYYDNGSGDLSVYGTTQTNEKVLMPKSQYKRILFTFTDNDGLSKEFYIFQVSGIVEEATQ